MAYDRFDTRPGREGSRQSEDERGRRDERGFFERAGDEIASWFGDDDERDDERRDRGERGRSWAAENGWGGDPERGRGEPRSPGRSRFDSERDQRRSSRPMMSGEGDYRSGSGSREGGYRPMTGDYGRSEEERGGGFGRSQSPWGRDEYRRTSSAGSGGGGREHDRHYSEWRQRQLDDLDRDYDDYHRERQQHFENDFGSWRQTRQQKRSMLGQAREQMEVVGSDGEPVGKIDRIAGDRAVLTKGDSPDGHHHSIPCTMIDRIEGDKVTLDCTAEQAQKQWRDDHRERALFEREDQGDAGPHMLDRSFSGTYRK
jgi:hypothetical protein